jgi:hypothetical protein
VGLLGSGDVDVQKEAVMAVWETVRDNSENNEAFCSAGAAAAICKLLQSPVAAVQMNAAGCINAFCASQHAKSQDAFRDAGCVPLLVGLLSSSSVDVQRRSSRALDALRNVLEDSISHAAAVKFMLTAGSVAVTRHRGGGCASPDYTLQFHGFNTFVADVKLCGGCFYWEVKVLEIVGGSVQFGCCTDGFESRDDPRGEGTGDDASSWAVCGHRQEKWHDANRGAFGSKWSIGDVIGFALDLRTVGAAVMSVSVNGSFAPPNGVVFSGIDAPYLSPALSGYGLYRVNFGDVAFAHAPPCSEFISVHDFFQDEDDDNLRLAKLLSVSVRDCSAVGGAPMP